ncbi:MAG: DNA polymerase III subunit beta [Proteobacteria bacterium]|nr:DNA polymerase III subunit beta [Pseudomonadota bacterium]
MKFTINKSDIKDVLAKVQGITGRKSSLAITANVLIKSTEKGISIAATDLETGFEGFYPAQIEEEGTIAINARKLFEIVNNFSSEKISFSENENRWIKISNKNVEFQIVGMDYDDFPLIPHIQDVDFIEIESGWIKDMIEKMIIISPDSEEKRAHILGVGFYVIDENDNKLIRMVSTDSKRLSKVDQTVNDKSNISFAAGIIIPKKGLGEVYKFLELEGLIKIGIKENHFILKKDNETIIISLLEGEFPDCSEIFTIEEDYHSIDMDKDLFLKMIKRMSIFYSDNYKNVVFYFDRDKLLIVSSNPDLGESKEDILINYYGKSFKSAFNPKYFIETLNVIDEENIVLNVLDEENPCFIKGKNDTRYLSVIMPMKM